MRWILKYGGIVVSTLGVLSVLVGSGLIVWSVFRLEEGRVVNLILAVWCISVGIGCVLLVAWERIMKLGIVERIRERRRVAAAMSMLEKYHGIDLLNSLEAAALPLPKYECSNGNCTYSYARHLASALYWVDVQPLIGRGWYCEDCVDRLTDKPKSDRLDMETFLIMLDQDFSSVDSAG